MGRSVTVISCNEVLWLIGNDYLGLGEARNLDIMSKDVLQNEYHISHPSDRCADWQGQSRVQILQNYGQLVT